MGPKTEVIFEVNEDHIVAVQAGNEQGEKFDPKRQMSPLLRRGRSCVLIYQE
ncbi:hypothetical protein KCP69_08915 [Salmonella enterica subsp. enterica]|nr:hypothetical protein KCP69_08915 [Salmonella enterica subsp. enterica]